MINPLQTYLTRDVALSVYGSISTQLGLDTIIFESMNHVARRREIPLELINSNATNAEKHEEIVRTLTQYFHTLERRGLLFELIEEIHMGLVSNGHQVHADRLREMVIVKTDHNFDIRLSADCGWLLDWSVVNSEQPKPKHVLVTSFHGHWGNVVPPHVIQYINSGLLLYQQKQYAAALVLMSIGVEATLRDLLTKLREYKNDPHASKVDIYRYTPARVDVSGSNYVLKVVGDTPKATSELPISAAGTLPADIQIRRVINSRANNRVDLSILAPLFLIDHLSTDQKEKDGEPKSIGGLNDALRFVREVEKIITPRDLPVDVDDVLKAVRNNLVHLSSDSMDEKLPKYNSLKQSGEFTLKDFVDNSNMVFGFMTEIPEFIDRQYIRLWKAGMHV